MLSFFSLAHALHAPTHEFFRGQLVPCHETPDRAEQVRQALADSGHRIETANFPDSRDVLAQVHAPRYLQFLETAWSQWLALDAANAGRQPWPSTWPVRTLRSDVEPQEFSARLGLYSMDSGTPLSAGSWAAAKAGADAALASTQALQRGDRAAFCASRPPGHHAGPDFMGGYCFLNAAAVAAQALRNQGCERVAIVDVDYHHGNGTQAIFYERADVLFVSLHGDPRTEYPFFLGHADETGQGAGAGFNLNLPLPAGSSAEAWFAALEQGCQRVQAHAPQALVVSLGLDTFEGDPISKFKLNRRHFEQLGRCLAALGLPTVFVLEGGYATADLGLNCVAVLNGFEGR